MGSQERRPGAQVGDEEKTPVALANLSTPPSTDDKAEAGPQHREPELVYPKRLSQVLILTSLCLSVCKHTLAAPLATPSPPMADG